MPEIDAACGLVSGLAGLDLRPYKEAVVLRRLQSRAKDLGFGGVRSYLAWLEKGGEDRQKEARRLFASVSVRVSRFFRDEDVFQHLEEHVFPAVVSDCPTGEAVRAWSAGCAHGQEPYSLAIGLLRSTAVRGGAPPVSVLGTDVDEGALAIARAGVYPEKGLKGVSREILAAHFDEAARGRLSVREPVRRVVRFERRDLLLFSGYPSGADLVCCRNLLIYLRREVQEELILALGRSLRPGGYLVLGQGETLLGRPWKAFDHLSPRHKVYRKPV